MKNNRGQLGETMTWVVATSIIVLVLVVAIFVTSLLGVVGSPKEYNPVGVESDLIPVKSLTSYLMTKDLDGSGKKIFDELKEEENLNEFNGNLAVKIFKGLFKNKKVSLNFKDKGNPYFEDIFVSETDPATGARLYFFEEIILGENKIINLFWSKT